VTLWDASLFGFHHEDQRIIRSGLAAARFRVGRAIRKSAHFVPEQLYFSMEKRQLTLREFSEIAIAQGVKPNTLRVWRQRESIPARWRLKFYEHFGSFEIIDWAPGTVVIITKRRTLSDIARSFIKQPTTSGIL
jgi:hypothetical protein